MGEIFEKKTVLDKAFRTQCSVVESWCPSRCSVKKLVRQVIRPTSALVRPLELGHSADEDCLKIRGSPSRGRYPEFKHPMG